MSTEQIPADAKLPAPETVEVSDGIFAYIQHDGSWCLNNPAFVAAADQVIAIDACATERRTRLFREEVARLSDQPVRTLVNTHAHLDHTFGNYLFSADAVIVGHTNCRAEILHDAPELPARARQMFPSVDWGAVEVVAPSLTFDDRLTLHAGGLELELIYVSPAHTNTDVVVWIPQRKVLIAGDIVFHRGTPFALMGSIGGWLDALERLRALGAETIIPGHGPIAGPAVLDDVDEYLRFVQEAARAGFNAGASPLEVARDLDLGRFAEWTDGERIVGNLHRAYSELRGEPRGAVIDTASAFAEMLEYNGGQPLRCLA